MKWKTNLTRRINTNVVGSLKEKFKESQFNQIVTANSKLQLGQYRVAKLKVQVRYQVVTADSKFYSVNVERLN